MVSNYGPGSSNLLISLFTHLNPLPHNPDFNDAAKTFENIVEKGRKAGNQHFLVFFTMISVIFKANFKFWVAFIFLSANTFNLDKAKISSSDMGLTLYFISTHFNTLKIKVFGKHCGKIGEIAQKEQFHLFPQRFVYNLYLKIL